MTVLDEKHIDRPVFIRDVSRSSTGKARAEYRCNCGNLFITQVGNVRNGHTRSCGCIRSSSKKTDNYAYGCWYNMKSRCDNPYATGYKNYGGRGISYSESWKDFDVFLADMGPRPDGYSIERLDVNGDYEPSNCVWTDQKTQMANTRVNHVLDYDGESLTISQWARRLELKPNTLLYRIRRGWSIGEALGFEPREKRHGLKKLTGDDEALAIKAVENGMTQTACGKMLGVDSSQISRLVNNP